MDKKNIKENSIIYELSIDNNHLDYTISTALEEAQVELEKIDETIKSIKSLKPECDKMDYILSASSGALCGIIDIFLVGKPKESLLNVATDKWFSKKTMDFAKMCGWPGGNERSAIGYLERKFKVPYDQRGCGDAGKEIFDLNPINHHFKSLGHNPTICGLFFSILDQFNNTSHFVSNGELITLEKADNKFVLKGYDVPSKIFCGFINWFGHIMSDISGSSGGKGRGAGIPSPFWTWTNDIIAIKNKLNIPVSDFDKNFNQLALKIYTEGYDIRFQTTQFIPVIINELVTRMIYSVRRYIKYIQELQRTPIKFKDLWIKCEPFCNVTIKRMLLVAHGSFCIVDIGDATIRALVNGKVNEFFMRVNIPGIGRFTILLYGEGKRVIQNLHNDEENRYYINKKIIISDYVDSLKKLAKKYNDKELLGFIKDLQNSNLYMDLFNKSIELAKQRDVPNEKILFNIKDIDKYFIREKKR